MVETIHVFYGSSIIIYSSLAHLAKFKDPHSFIVDIRRWCSVGWLWESKNKPPMVIKVVCRFHNSKSQIICFGYITMGLKSLKSNDFLYNHHHWFFTDYVYVWKRLIFFEVLKVTETWSSLILISFFSKKPKQMVMKQNQLPTEN